MNALSVTDKGRRIALSFDDLLNYHGPGYPGGVAHAFKAMERAFPLLAGGEPPERDEIHIATPFSGPGARDAFEMTTRAVTRGRFTLAPELARSDVTPAWRGRYVFRFTHRGATVAVMVRDGLVREEFLALGQRAQRETLSPEDEARLSWLKDEMANRLLSLPADQVYDVIEALAIPGGSGA
ncbi:MAG: hypothetical protein BGP06_11705 [Rhizobiales bacterium 65-9]|nr:hypothetical protein [Hyphomicrobiales bacterium]OJY33954.1 MAG: hypothetical protein BGP06_11705 [Rhizobiales bacterium 65-9]